MRWDVGEREGEGGRKRRRKRERDGEGKGKGKGKEKERKRKRKRYGRRTSSNEMLISCIIGIVPGIRYQVSYHRITSVL